MTAPGAPTGNRHSLAVLGIDAAWTRARPSGIALLEGVPGDWRWIRVAPSFASFVEGADDGTVGWTPRRADAPLDVEKLLAMSRQLLGDRDVDVVTIDMPIATRPIVGRRTADDVASSALGAAKAAVHSPTPERPGRMGQELTDAFLRAGFSIATAETTGGTLKKVVEVYPHAALIALLKLRERFRYKVAKTRTFWPSANAEERLKNVRAAFEQILTALAPETSPAPFVLPASPVRSLASLKAYEDAIDAMLCAWVGARYVEGRAHAWGDDTAAIWAPVEEPVPYRSGAMARTASEAMQQRVFLPRDLLSSNRLAFSLSGYQIAEEVVPRPRGRP